MEFVSVIKNIVLVAAGGAVGSVCRYGMTLAASHLAVRAEFATMAANILGSFLIGLWIPDSGSRMYLFYTAGVCGGFTTFSTFSSQTMRLFQNGQYALGVLYVAATVIISLIMVWFGWYCRQKFI